MPKGSKICSSCNSLNGPRAFNCKSCGNSFTFKQNTDSTKKTPLVKETLQSIIKSKEVVGQNYDPIKHLVYVPSGTCPVTLQDMTPEGAVEWARKIRNMNPNINYSTNALRYWMRGYVDPITQEDLYDELSAAISN